MVTISRIENNPAKVLFTLSAVSLLTTNDCENLCIAPIALYIACAFVSIISSSVESPQNAVFQASFIDVQMVTIPFAAFLKESIAKLRPLNFSESLNISSIETPVFFDCSSSSRKAFIS